MMGIAIPFGLGTLALLLASDRTFCDGCSGVKSICLVAQQWRGIGRFLAIGWALIPPIWFIAEWRLWLRENPCRTESAAAAKWKLDFDRFKHGQELATKVWAAIATVAAALILRGG
jgi:hypothetical protein